MCVYEKITVKGIDYYLTPVDSEKLEIMTVGKNYLIRGVTNYQVGRFVGFVHEGTAVFAILQEASWVADTGKFSNCLKTGTFNEVEWVPKSRVPVNLNAVMDIFEWTKELPSETK